jgi:site-specific DNA recombinase
MYFLDWAENKGCRHRYRDVMRAARYARLSRNRQGLSTNTQVQLEESSLYIEDEGWTLAVTHFDDDVSASRYTTKPRPGVRRALGRLQLRPR